MRIGRQNLQYVAGCSQLCTGQIGGYKAAVHVMKEILPLFLLMVFY